VADLDLLLRTVAAKEIEHGETCVNEVRHHSLIVRKLDQLKGAVLKGRTSLQFRAICRIADCMKENVQLVGALGRKRQVEARGFWIPLTR